MSESTHLEEALERELTHLNQAEKEVESTLFAMSNRLAEVRRRKTLVQALLGTGEGKPAMFGLHAAKSTAGKSTMRAPSGSNGRNVSDVAYDILVARGKKPMHYEELADAVIAAGGILGGQTPSQTLVARITRDPRFVRPDKRGWYAAKEFYPNKRSVGSRRGGTKPSAKATTRP